MSTITHDYTRRTHGHDFCFTPHKSGRLAEMMGWGCGIKERDYLILPNGEDTTRYEVLQIDYYGDPADMWKAIVAFAPREKAE